MADIRTDVQGVPWEGGRAAACALAEPTCRAASRVGAVGAGTSRVRVPSQDDVLQRRHRAIAALTLPCARWRGLEAKDIADVFLF